MDGSCWKLVLRGSFKLARGTGPYLAVNRCVSLAGKICAGPHSAEGRSRLRRPARCPLVTPKTCRS